MKAQPCPRSIGAVISSSSPVGAITVTQCPGCRGRGTELDRYSRVPYDLITVVSAVAVPRILLWMPSEGRRPTVGALDYRTAQALTTELAGLPLAHDVVAACSARTQACVDYMLLEGVPQEALGTAANLVADFSPAGIDRAYASGQVMHVRQPFAPLTLARRIAHADTDTTPAHIRREGEVREGDASFIRQTWSGIPGVSVGTVGEPRRFWFPETTHESQFANHFAPALWVTRNGRPPALMVIDTAQNKRQPLSISQWRAGQNCPGAVSAVAPVGRPFRIHWETARLDQVARLGRILGVREAALPDAVAKRWQRLSPERHRGAIAGFFRFRDPSGPMPPDATEFAAEYSASLGTTMTSAAPLFAPGRDLRGTVENAVKLFAPLETYEKWLRRTDSAAAQPLAHDTANQRTRQPRLRPPVPDTARRERGVGRDLGRE